MGETENPLICMASGFLDVSLSLKSNYFDIWIRQDTPKNSRNPKSLVEVCFLKSHNVGIYHLEETGTEQSRISALKFLERLEDGINRILRT